MRGQQRKLRTTLRHPERVLQSRVDPLVHLYFRFFRRTPVGQKFLMAAVKIGGSDAFVVTAFFTGEVRGGPVVWAK
jgi:hypothetical protein